MATGSHEFTALISGAIMVLILLSLFGNILVCFAVYYSRSLRARVNYLIVSLAITDIMIASICMPIWMTFEITAFSHLSHKTTVRLKTFWMFVDVLGAIASIANLTAISYERLWSVWSPFNHRRYLTNSTAAIIISIVWTYAIVAATTIVSWIEWKYVTIYSAAVGFFFPLILIFVAYLSIIVIVNRTARNVISSQDNRRINLTIGIIVGLFILCWAPHFIGSILTHHCHSCFIYFAKNLRIIRPLFKWLHYFNSCLNPLVYGIANAQYKEAFKSVFKKLCFGFFKTNSKENEKPQRSIYYPRQLSDTSKAQFVELTPEDKDQHGARSGLYTNGTNIDSYLPGDYRALPRLPPSRESRWNSDVSDTLIAGSVLDDSAALKKALLDPESLSRTSYI